MVPTRAQRRYLLCGQQAPLHNDHYISDCNVNICPASGYKTLFMGHSGFYTSYLPPPQAAFQIVGSLEYNVQPVNFPLTPELEDWECLDI